MNEKPPITEKAFQAQIVQLAKLTGWRYYHTYDSRRSVGGFPDLTLVRAEHLLFLEAKREKRSRTSPEQIAWNEDLGKVEVVEAHIVRPSDWEFICQLLAAGRKET